MKDRSADRRHRAEVIHELVKVRGTTWANLCRATGITRNKMYGISTGRPLRESETRVLANALGVDAADLSARLGD